MESQQQALPLSTVMPLLGPQYPSEYYEGFTKLKLLLQKEQFTAEANRLCEILIPYLQSNYNCWYVKKQCLKNGTTTYEHQDSYSKQILMGKVKNFQIWDFRKDIISTTKKFQEQYQLIQETLQIEYKNYHAWSYRAFVVTLAKNYLEQLHNLAKHILNDEGNNSVWSYRYFLICEVVAGNSNADEQSRNKIVKQQLTDVIKLLQKQTNYTNEALWNYLRGFFPSIKLKNFPSKKVCQTSHIVTQSYADYPQIALLCKTIIQKHSTNLNGYQALVTLVCIDSHSEKDVEYAKNTCQVLMNLEPKKKYYWKWVQNNF